jgi:hypothetical protein
LNAEANRFLNRLVVERGFQMDKATDFIIRRVPSGEWYVYRLFKVGYAAGPFDTREEAEEWIKENVGTF